MNQHYSFWSFKSKDQRRRERDLEKQSHEHSEKERSAEIANHTHLDVYGRKGLVGLARSMPSFFRHARNLVYAKWTRTKSKI